MTTIAVLGTGIMGAPMARNIAEGGHDVRVWNRTRSKAEPLSDVATVVDAPAEAVAGAELVVTMLLDAAAVRDTIDGAGLSDGQVWIQMSTVGQDIDDLAALAATQGAAFVDAPVLGTKGPAEQGTLTVLAAPGPVSRDRLAPVFDAVGGRTLWLGDPGAASRLKLVANAWVVGLLGVLGDVIALAEGIGVEPQAFFDAVDGSAVDAPYVHLKGKAMVDRDYGVNFTASGARKDLGLILAAASGAGLPAAVLSAVRDEFDSAIADGHGDADMAAVVEASRRHTED